MPQENIFSIENMRCAYKGDQVVVEIDKLDIPRGSFVGLLSISGGGKSTTLENLGLMNRTFLSGSRITLSPSQEESYDYEELWKDSNERLRAKIRSQHFSFIFQQTNLMPNFSAYENICIAQMIQGKPKAEAIAHAKEVMELIGLGQVSAEKKSYELSGGEQQRVAFARAITPEFSIIFGDEPTGNLDNENSHALMGKLHETVKKRGRSAIIVSHDLDLIQTYADHLVVLTKENELGCLKAENIFSADTDDPRTRRWQDGNGKEVKDLTPYIKAIMKNQSPMSIK
jgi:ABC-type lipoprotein export system ATPase subunit